MKKIVNRALIKLNGPKIFLLQLTWCTCQMKEQILTHWQNLMFTNRDSLKIIFLYFSTKTHVVGTQKNRLNERVLLSTKNMC